MAKTCLAPPCCPRKSSVTAEPQMSGVGNVAARKGDVGPATVGPLAIACCCGCCCTFGGCACCAGAASSGCSNR